ncbi:hypothetical protein B0H12DRAFT_1082623 [Mycena haematopus]|nr:hypothetical protein B0H12DRAFT_1082623 [Mycena haematopus]
MCNFPLRDECSPSGQIDFLPTYRYSVGVAGKTSNDRIGKLTYLTDDGADVQALHKDETEDFPRNNYKMVAALFTAEEAADKLAAVLGLTPTGFTVKHRNCVDASEELRDLWAALMPCEDEDPTDPIVCAFCARFLPSLISAYKAAPCVEGPYHCMLLAVLQSNYFAKYMRTPLGSELYAFFANQILSKNHPSESVVGLLIFATYAHEYKARMRPLSDETLAQLKGWLRSKAEESLEIIRPDSSRRGRARSASPTVVFHERTLSHIVSVLNIMDGRLKFEAMQLTLTRRNTFDRYAERHENSKKLTRFACARCQTVAYCCRVHQKEDWSFAIGQRETYRMACFPMRDLVPATNLSCPTGNAEPQLKLKYYSPVETVKAALS